MYRFLFALFLFGGLALPAWAEDAFCYIGISNKTIHTFDLGAGSLGYTNYAPSDWSGAGTAHHSDSYWFGVGVDNPANPTKYTLFKVSAMGETVINYLSYSATNYYTLGHVTPGGLAYDNVNSILYLMGQENVGGVPNYYLYTVNTSNGVMTQIGDQGTEPINGIAMDFNGILWGAGGHLWKLFPDGSAKEDHGTLATSIQAIAVGASGKLWGLGHDDINHKNKIYTIADGGTETLKWSLSDTQGIYQSIMFYYSGAP